MIFSSKMVSERCLADLGCIVTLSTTSIQTAVCTLEKPKYLEIPRGRLLSTWSALFAQIPKGSKSSLLALHTAGEAIVNRASPTPEMLLTLSPVSVLLSLPSLSL